MKVSSSVFNANYGKSSGKAILPLEPVKGDEIPSSQMITHTLHSTPGDADSPKYKITTNILQGDEGARDLLAWHKKALLILEGLNITTMAPAIPVIGTLLAQTPMALFNSGIEASKTKRWHLRIQEADDDDAAEEINNQGKDHADNAHFEHIENGLKNVVQQLLPQRVLARVKRYIRRECRKPAEMKVRTYFNHLMRINVDEIPRLPPFEEDQKFSSDEVLDILLFGTPKSWQREMEKQGFDPMEKKLNQVVDKMESLESTEDFEYDNTTKSVAKKGNGNGKGGKKSTNSKGKQNLYCMLHGEGGHKTEDCYQLQKEAKRVKMGKSDNSSKSKNKTWTRKAAESSKESKKDLAAFIRKEVKKGVKKDLKAISKKRKSESDDSDSDGDLHAFDLKDFNYEDMENLKIDDDSVDGISM
jgi:hypothetical protein